ncbi:MAG: Coenzyme F420 hydrogenase/dehydrogenase, beta subunit C-terminal domain [Acidobacteria bacterium]|nr:Coenzyme F420 hydrogenase/dehydrogenase, beta subunit C-terminal domain [Acidobacteriota bacterium]
MTTDTERQYGQWKELYYEVVSTGLCTGCAACVMTCPRDVLEYEHPQYHPYNVEESTAFDNCMHGERGCDICAKACPRFRLWEVESDTALFGRTRLPEEVFGIAREVVLTRANDPAIQAVGQDGGLVSTLLVWGLEHGKIDGALTSHVSKDPLWDCEPWVATNREEVLASAGSRYTYAANALAMKEAEKRGLKSLALVGMGCQTSMNGTLSARSVAKYRRRITLTLGLLCSKSFTYPGLMVGKIQNDLGIPLDDIAKVNIKGKFQIWRKSTGEEIDVPLKECQPFMREGCTHCPDFSAEHADISTGGIGAFQGWTLTIVRTERGAEWLKEISDAGWISVKDVAEDPGVMKLLRKMAAKQRERWPVDSLEGDARAPGAVPPPSAGASAGPDAPPKEQA